MESFEVACDHVGGGPVIPLRGSAVSPLVQDRAEAERYIAALAGSADATVTFQTFDDDEAKERRDLARVLHGRLDQHWQDLVRLNREGAGIFVMVNEGDGVVHAGKKTCRTASNVRALRALFVDDDVGELTPTALELPPSIVVQSKRGIHAYWKLRPGESLERFTASQVSLSQALGTPPDDVKDLPRVMRLPGFFHRKAEPFLVRLVQITDVTYSIDEILAAYPAPLVVEAPRQPPRKPSLNGPDRGGYGAGALRKAAANIIAAPEGKRNIKLNDQAYGIGQLVGGGVISRGEAEAVLEQAALEAGLSVGETRATIRSGLEAGEKEPRGVPQRVEATSAGSPAPSASENLGAVPAGDPLPLSDLGNAERLVRRHGRDLHFCHPWGQWQVWDGTRWKPDDTAEVERRAKDTIRAIASEADEEQDSDARRAILKHALKSEDGKRRREMLAQARSEAGIPVLPAQLDTDGMVFNVLNGTLDLRTGALRPHRREDLITKIAPVIYDATATCPNWGRFLERIIPNPEVRNYLQRAIGYCMTGDVGAQVLFFAFGGGANGKSTLLNTVMRLWSDYATRAPSELLLASRNDRHPTEKTVLHGRRIAVCYEVNEGRRFDLEAVKALTGGDRITARGMRQDFWSFDPQHKLWLAANAKPRVVENDEATWRRVQCIPFEVTIPKEERDPALPEKLVAEGPGILNWALRGCLDWQSAGGGIEGLDAPAAVRQATADYREREDVVGVFLDECCTRSAAARVGKNGLFNEYGRWCAANQETAMQKNAFGGHIERLPDVKGARGKGGRFWRGIGLRGALQQVEFQGEAA